MDKRVYDIVKQYSDLTEKLYQKLEAELGVDKAEKLLDEFQDLREKTLKIGKYLKREKVSHRRGYLSKDYNNLKSYLSLSVIYSYDNGYSLCETTDGEIELVPTDLIKTDSP